MCESLHIDTRVSLFKVKCTGHSACSGKPVTVVITDECPGGPCLAEAVHFDMSGSAFGSLARAGMADLLRNVGTLDVLFVRFVPRLCRLTTDEYVC